MRIVVKCTDGFSFNFNNADEATLRGIRDAVTQGGVIPFNGGFVSGRQVIQVEVQPSAEPQRWNRQDYD